LTPALISGYTLKLPDKKFLKEKVADIIEFSEDEDNE
jgi:hypothetical protein